MTGQTNSSPSSTGSERTLAAYTASVASSAPAPGGGSVAAVTGALACALGQMVCAITLKGRVEERQRASLESLNAELEVIRGRFFALADDDEAAFTTYRAAASLPKSTDDEKRIRRDALEQALVHAAEVPLATAECCLGVLERLIAVTEIGTKHALSDVFTGALLAEASLRGALTNVEVNAALMKDAETAQACRERAASLEANGRDDTARVLAVLATR